MSKEEITCKIPNNQIHISKEKDEDCLIWISPKAINMSNTIDELQQQNQKYKEVIDKLKELIIDNIEETTYEYIGSNKIKVLQKLIMDNDGVNELLDILKEVE